MAPYSLSACQVVRVLCAVLRALGASPIMSLGIVFLAGYPTLRTAKNARPQHFFREFWIFSATATTQHNTTQNTTQHGATFRPLTTQRYGPVITSTAAIFRGKSSDRQRSEGSSYLKAITAQYLWRRGKIL
eukprot:scaffold304_cov141-Skeletonema_marinoi.AAC.1